MAENSQRETIQSDLNFVKQKIAAEEIQHAQNITVINSPGNVTLIVPNSSAHID